MKKEEGLSLFTIDKKKYEQMDEEEIQKIMSKLDIIKIEAVKDGRFLGNLKRCRKCQKMFENSQRQFG